MNDLQISAEQAYANSRTGIAAIVAETEKLLTAKQVRPASKKKVEKDAKFKAFVTKWNIPVSDKVARATGFGGAGVASYFVTTFGDGSPEHKAVVSMIENVKKLNELIKAKGKSEKIAPLFMRGTGTPRTKAA